MLKTCDKCEQKYCGDCKVEWECEECSRTLCNDCFEHGLIKTRKHIFMCDDCYSERELIKEDNTERMMSVADHHKF